MQATKETVQKRPHTALWIILCVVLLCAVGAALYFCRWAEKPLTLAEGYVAAEGLTADITDGEGGRPVPAGTGDEGHLCGGGRGQGSSRSGAAGAGGGQLRLSGP